MPSADTLRHPHSRPRVLVFIVAYNAEKTISEVVRRVPKDLAATYDLEVLIIDDASRDATFAEGHTVSKAEHLPFPVRALFNPVNQGYGGNQKLGYHYAIEKGFDFVALLHGDGQYAPECLPQLLEPVWRGEADAVMGSRMLDGGALKGGMPLYKFIGNKVLTWCENRLLSTNLSEFHSGYRVYSVEALRAIPFDRNSGDFHFDTEIIIQMLIAGRTIRELPIPTYYGDEICHVSGLKYAANVLMAALKARLQEMSLFYDRRFDCAPEETYSPSTPKFTYQSPHTMTLDRISPGARVLDLGCVRGDLGSALQKVKRCHVTGMGINPVKVGTLDEFRLWDLNTGVPAIEANQYEAVVMLDVIEHINRPESFLEELRQRLSANPSIELLISSGNVGFFITRAMLLVGQFNYGKRGILDMTHTRLFTFGSLRRALMQAGFDILETRGIPGPYPLAIGDNWLSRGLLFINRLLIRFSRGLFAYQIFMRAKPQPSLQSLLNRAERESQIRVLEIEKVGARTGSY